MATATSRARSAAVTALVVAAFMTTAALPSAATPAGDGETKTFSMYGDWMTLKPSQVHNGPMAPISLPQDVIEEFADGTPMVVKNYQLDIVSGEGPLERSVPLFEVYSHHYLLWAGSKQAMQVVYEGVPKCTPPHPNSTSAMASLPEKHRRAIEKACNGHMQSGPRCADAVNAALSPGRASSPPTPPPGSVVTFGGASGGEFRHNPHNYGSGFGLILDHPEALVVVNHVINTYGTTRHTYDGADGWSSPFIECPCTSRRTKQCDLSPQEIDHCVVAPPFQCNEAFTKTNNPACNCTTYRGGFRCAPTGSFLAEDYENVSPVNKTQTVRMKFTFEYAPKTAMPDVRSMTATSCCDVTGDMKLTANVDFVNIEYDVPKCAEGTPPENCTHVATAVQPLDDMGAPESWVDLTYAVGHAHTGAILLELYDNVTGQLLCSSAPSYGNTSNAGDEYGYLVGIEPCVWSALDGKPPPRLQRKHPIRSVVVYNNTEEIIGVMGLWIMAASEVPTE